MLNDVNSISADARSVGRQYTRYPLFLLQELSDHKDPTIAKAIAQIGHKCFHFWAVRFANHVFGQVCLTVNDVRFLFA